MKNFLVAFALVGCIVACNTEKRSVSDPAAPNAPAAGCCEGMKANCDAAKAGCDAAKAECSGKKTCTMSAQKPQG